MWKQIRRTLVHEMKNANLDRAKVICIVTYQEFLIECVRAIEQRSNMVT